MLRRSILQFSHRRSLRRIFSQRPMCYNWSKQYSSATNFNKARKPDAPESGSSLPKIAIGGVAVGAAIVVAYRAGYLDQYLGEEERRRQLEAVKVGVEKGEKSSGEQLDFPSGEKRSTVSSNVGLNEEKVESREVGGVGQSQEQDISGTSIGGVSEGVRQEGTIPVQETELREDSGDNISSANQSTNHQISSEESTSIEHHKSEVEVEPHQGDQVASISLENARVPEENETRDSVVQDQNVEAREEHVSINILPENALLDDYHLRGNTATSSNGDPLDRHKLISEDEAFVAALENFKDGYMSKDGKLIFDFLQAIHAAEKRQAALDASAFAEEKRAIKEKYEKELKDAMAREFMHAEEAKILDKELKRERVKAAAAIKSLHEKAVEKLKTELEQKEKETELELEKVEELAKAELAAAIAAEKAAQIEKMAEANVDINALCMAFFARSEEARRSHSIHKLTLGALALEDALSKGLPIQKEIKALHHDLKETDNDPILKLVLSSLPEETRTSAVDTSWELNQKFNDLKRSLRHYSLIPPGGGGILAHSVAHVASWLRIRESNQSGEGIESVINKVEAYLAEGKLAEAADVLERGVEGSKAAEVASDWVKRARNRAIAEQAFTFLQAYITTSSLQ